LLFLAICHIMLDVNERESPDIVEMRNYGLVTLRENRLSEMQGIGQLKSLARVCIPLHDVLPLLEEPHSMKLLEEGDVFEDILVDAIGDEVLIRDEFGCRILSFADRYKALLAKDHDASVIIRGVFHLLVH